MSQLADIICATLIHSLWQAALLRALFFVLRPHPADIEPQVGKNLVLLLMILMPVLSLMTALGMASDGIAPLSKWTITTDNAYPISSILLLAYLLVLAYKLLALAAGLRSLPIAMGRETCKAPAEWRIFTALKAAELSIKKKINIRLSPRVASPCTYGFWKPVILLPAGILTQLSPVQVEMLIIHELGHIKNKDYLTNILLKVLESLYFFNPFMLQMAEAFRLERESACDRLVMQHPYPAVSYAETLMGLTGMKPTPALHAVSGRKHLLERMKRLPGYKHKLRQFNPFLSWIILPGLLFMMLVALRPEYNWLEQRTFQMAASQKITPEITSVVIASATKRPPAVAYRKNNTKDLQPSKLRQRQMISPSQQKSESGEGNNASSSLAAAPASDDEQRLKKIARYASLANDLSEKTITLVEESGHKTITRHYRLFYREGAWQYQLLWAMEERLLPLGDSAL